MGAVSSVVDAVGDLGQGVIDVVSDAGSAVDDFVNDTIPGGWVLPVAVATAGAAGAFGAGAAAGEAAGAGLAAGEAGTAAGLGDLAAAAEFESMLPAVEAATAPVTAGTVVEAGLPALAPEAVATSEGVAALSPEAGSLGTASDLPWSGYTPDQVNALNNVTITPDVPVVPEYTPELNVGTATPPVNEGIAALSPEPVSGMDLAADATAGNTAMEAGQGLGALPTTTPTPMEPANPQDFGATIENGGVAPETVANPVGTGDPGSAPLDTTSTLPGENAGAPGSSYVTTPGGGIADITGAAAPAAAAAGTGLWSGLAAATGLSEGTLQTIATGLGLGAAGSALGNMLSPQTTTNAQGSYTGPLAGYKFNPSTYTPYEYKPYANGGPIQEVMNNSASDIPVGYSDNVSEAIPAGTAMAAGGIANLGSYSDGGRLLRGPGDGVSDSIPAVIGNKQPARLADGEFVIPARIVSELGNGSTEAGARQLYAMMDRIQAARRKTVGKQQVAKDTKASKNLPA